MAESSEPVLSGEFGRLLTFINARFELLESSVRTGFEQVARWRDDVEARTRTLEQLTATLNSRVQRLNSDGADERHADLQLRGLSRGQKALVGAGAGVTGMSVLYALVELGKMVMAAVR
jgi:hypothetical protein